MSMELDLSRLFEVPQSHEVVYVLIGGLAAVFHGSPFPTAVGERKRWRGDCCGPSAEGHG